MPSSGQFIIVETADASGGAKSKVVPLNLFWTPFQVTLRALVTGTVNYTLQYTMDNLRAAGFSEASADWTSIPAATGATAAVEVTLISPVTAVRLLQNSGSGSVSLRCLQAGGK